MTEKNPFQAFSDIDFSKFELSKILGDLKIPGIDMEAMLAAQRKNIEALTTANRLAVEGMQAVAKRQAEILAQAMTEVSEMTQQFAKAGNPQEMSAKQAELSKEAFEKALANMREMAELINKANAEVFTVINKRVSESIDELKNLLAKK
jgi:phasin family protein